jgi:hypothetical protein
MIIRYIELGIPRLQKSKNVTNCENVTTLLYVESTKQNTQTTQNGNPHLHLSVYFG